MAYPCKYEDLRNELVNRACLPLAYTVANSYCTLTMVIFYVLDKFWNPLWITCIFYTSSRLAIGTLKEYS